MLTRLISSVLSKVGHNNRSVCQDWVLELSHKDQSSLLSAIRGTDIDGGKDSKAKDITKMIRYLVINRDVPKKSKYMNDNVVLYYVAAKYLISKWSINEHWVEHIMFAGYIIRDNHPDTYVRMYWKNLLGKVWHGIKLKKEKIKKNNDKINLAIATPIIDKYNRLYGNGYL